MKKQMAILMALALSVSTTAAFAEEATAANTTDDAVVIEEALPFLFSHRCKCVVYTQGKDGATLYRRNDHISAKGHQVQVVDTTGAGDSFIGAFLYCLLKEESDDLEAIPLERMKHHLEFANLYAAHTTTMAGALAAMADQEQLREFHHALYDDDDDSSLYL